MPILLPRPTGTPSKILLFIHIFSLISFPKKPYENSWDFVFLFRVVKYSKASGTMRESENV